jgi:YfiH family protein
VRSPPHRDWIVPDWPASSRVRSLVTTRAGGVSSGPFASLNLGARVGDDPQCVARNRAIVRASLPAEPAWMRQVHGSTVIDAAQAAPDAEADAAVTRRPGCVCAVTTADCLPIFLSERDGRVAGVAHAGWRGLARGVIESALRAMEAPPEEIIAYLGPGIGARRYEVGGDVREAFVDADKGADACFAPQRGGKYLADLVALARRRLAAAGVAGVYGGEFCTASDARFFSYRRDRTTGRMASLIWLEDE